MSAFVLRGKHQLRGYTGTEGLGREAGKREHKGFNEEFVSVAEQDGGVEEQCWGLLPLCCSPEEGALLVSVCPCLLSRQHREELEPLGLHTPLAVLCCAVCAARAVF